MKLARSLAVTAIAIAALPFTAVAQPECVLGPISLPALNGPPVWVGAPGADDWRPQLHDPRWSGAPLRSFGDRCLVPSGAPDPDTCSLAGVAEGQFRVLKSGDYLYVSYQALADSSDEDFFDTVYFGITHGTTNLGGDVAEVHFNPGAASVAAPAPSVPADPVLPAPIGGGFVNHWSNSNATNAGGWGTATAGIPTWMEEPVLWKASDPATPWAVTFKVNVGAGGLNVAGPFKAFFGMLINHAGTGVGTAGVVRLSLPNAVLQPSSVGSSTIVPNDATNWLDMADLSVACASGIDIASSGVGVWTGSDPLSIHVQTACAPMEPGCPPQENTFRVRPTNVPASAWGTNGVRARIRFANWGSMVANWKFAPWTAIPGMENPFTTSTLSSAWGWAFDGSGGVTIDYTCIPQAGDDYCPKLTNETEDHQCMLVELGSPPGQNLQFQRAAIYRNMTFDDLSTSKRVATITTRGLQALTGVAKDRDVYLYVQTTNMPPQGNEPLWLDSKAMGGALRFAEHPPNLRPIRREDPKANKKKKQAARRRGAQAEAAEAAPAAAAMATAPQGRLPEPAISPAMSAQQAMDGAWPTYRVHVYYDTGETMVLKDQTRRILQPMLPFGTYYSHSGPLYGFSHALEGLGGVTLEEVGPNFYKVVIPNEGTVRVAVSATAHETPAGPTCKEEECPPPKVIEKVVIKETCHCGVVGARSEPTHLAVGALLLGCFGGFLLLRRIRRRGRNRG